MAASYPTSVWTPPGPVTDDDGAGGGTALTASLIIAPNEEVEAIEIELGGEPHSISGSVAERVQFELQPSGVVRNKCVTTESIAGAGDPTKMRSVQAGVTVVVPASDGTWTVTFPDAFASTPNVFCMATGT